MNSISFPIIPNWSLKLDTLRVGEHSRHDRDTSPINDQQSTLESQLTPVHSTITSSLIYKHHILFPSSRDTRSCPRFDQWYLYTVFSLITNKSIYLFSWHCILRDLVTHLQSFIDAIVIEWAKSINLSHGWTNPALGAHATTYPISIHECTFLVIQLRQWHLMQSKQPQDVVIRCDFTV
jgi:hypothetical protein